MHSFIHAFYDLAFFFSSILSRCFSLRLRGTREEALVYQPHAHHPVDDRRSIFYY